MDLYFKMQQPKACLRRVGITGRATWLQWARRNHPDKGGCTALFQEICNAYTNVYATTTTKTRVSVSRTCTAQTRAGKPCRFKCASNADTHCTRHRKMQEKSKKQAAVLQMHRRALERVLRAHFV